jgi:hypothetical protein
VLIGIAVFGLLGVVAAALAARRSSPPWTAVTWAVCGGLIAFASVSVMTCGPFVLAAALAVGGAAVVVSRWTWRRLLLNVGAGSACAIVSFGVLLAIVTRVGVDMVGIPEGSLVRHAFDSTDYADAFRVSVPQGAPCDLEAATRAVMRSMQPSWLGDTGTMQIDTATLQPGTSAGHWPVYGRGANEIVLGLDRSHIDLRLSVSLGERDGNQEVTVATVARFNNWRGRVYFIPVRFGHQIVIADTMRKTKELLRSTP